jgi:AraC-like DNA-binding protein
VREPLARAAADVIASAVAENISGNRRAAADPRRILLDRVKASIEEQLGDPGLNPRAIADQHHVSLRYLHLLFQREGTTVNGWIRERRLEGARRALSAPDARRRSVAAVAARWGFANASHFSRAFREAFGVPPVQWRSGGGALTAVAPCIAGQNLGRAET